MAQNNVIRFLEGQKVPHTVFELPEEKLSALETARLLNLPPEQIFKSIVAVRSRPGKPVLAIIPGPLEVNLKSLAEIVGEKKVQPATQREAEQLTGLKTGGISPLALMNRGFQFCLDESALLFEEINISGGQLGLNIRLGVNDLVRLIHPLIGDISQVP
jgi:Cys-tRNA(Pro)/Cys-tRNA(Cys) deacylase